MLYDLLGRLRERRLGPTSLGILLFYAAAYGTAYEGLWRLVTTGSPVLLGAGLVGRSVASVVTPAVVGWVEDRHPHLERVVLILSALALVVAAVPAATHHAGILVATIVPLVATAAMAQSSPRALSVDPRLSVAIGWLIDGGKLVGALTIPLLVLFPHWHVVVVGALALSAVTLLSRPRPVATHENGDERPADADPRADWPTPTWVTLMAVLSLPSLSGFSYDLGLTWSAPSSALGLGVWVAAGAVGALLGTLALLGARDGRLRAGRVGWADLLFYLAPIALAVPSWPVRLVALVATGFGAAYFYQLMRALVWRTAPARHRGRIWAAQSIATALAGVVGQLALVAVLAHTDLATVRWVAPIAGSLLCAPAILLVRRHLRRAGPVPVLTD